MTTMEGGLQPARPVVGLIAVAVFFDLLRRSA